LPLAARSIEPESRGLAATGRSERGKTPNRVMNFRQRDLPSSRLQRARAALTALAPGSNASC
jgi:hypothetical protein